MGDHRDGVAAGVAALRGPVEVALAALGEGRSVALVERVELALGGDAQVVLDPQEGADIGSSTNTDTPLPVVSTNTVDEPNRM